MEVNVPDGGSNATVWQKDYDMENSDFELIALRRVASAADELTDAIYTCDETIIPGCSFEIEFTELQAALSALPCYFEHGRYIWKEIEEDYRQDAPGG